jgi:peptidoglycan hydrolase-like protein with peptidoglycan-binding domain
LKRYDEEDGKDRNDVIAAIRHLQEELNKYGNYGLAVDGIIGPKTIAAYQKFRSGV